MRVLIVEPEKVPYEEDIDPCLSSLQTIVGGHIQVVYPFDDPVAIVCNDEGKLLGMPLNRALLSDDGEIYDIIAGKFIITGLQEEEFADLSSGLMEKYKKQFWSPELFTLSEGRIIVIKEFV